MDNMLSILSHDIIALLTIVNPIAAASIMVSMLPSADKSIVSPIAKKASLTLFIASMLTLFSGEALFKLFGINVLSLKVIGGIILMMIAINMAYGHESKSRHSQEEHDEAQTKEDISIVPVGIPILFGPGMIATIIVLNNNNMQVVPTMIGYGMLSFSIAVVSIIVYMTLYYAGSINKALGITGMKILTRIMGLIVGAIAAQFLVGGIKGLWATM